MKKYIGHAIVTDGLWRKSVSVIRALGQAGYKVTVFGDSILSTGLWSGFTSERVIASSAAHNQEKFGTRFLSFLDTLDSEMNTVLFPMEDATLHWVSNNLSLINEKVKVVLPPLESLNIAQDKAATIKLASELGIPCPKTVYPNDIEEFLFEIESWNDSDVVVKPIAGSGSIGIVYGKMSYTVSDWRRHWENFGQLVLQERISPKGRGIGVSLLMDDGGECVAGFVHQRINQYPNSGGPSTNRESIHNEDLLQKSIRLLKKMSWRGVAMVEWKLDPKDNVPKLMEINPRFWGSLELAIRSGVNFPVMYAEIARGFNVVPCFDYQDFVKCRWLIPGDILRYLTQNKSERETLLEFLKGLPGEAEEWNMQDIRGTLACAICPALVVINPRYWKYLKRN